MRALFKLIMVHTLITLVLKSQYCDGYSTTNYTVLQQPQKTVGIIELTVPRQFRQENRKTIDTRESYTAEVPGYNIYINPNRNSHDFLGGRKIKIVLESDDMNNRKSISKNFSGVGEEYYEAVPLAINGYSLNVDSFDQKKTDKSNSTRHVMSSNSNKRQIYETHNVRNNTNIAIQCQPPCQSPKAAHIEKDVSREVNIYGYEYVSQPFENRDIRNKPKAVATAEHILHGSGKRVERVEDTYKRMVPENKFQEVPQTYRVPLPENKYRPSVTERIYDSTTLRYNNQPKIYNDDDPVAYTEKVLIYEPQIGISAAKIVPGSVPNQPFVDELGTHSGAQQNSYHLHHEERRNFHSSEVIPEVPSFISSTSVPFEDITEKKQVTRRSDPAQENSYSGFPESYTANLYDIPRKVSYEVVNSLPPSPCSDVFKYTNLEDDRWYAEIYVRTDEVLTGLRLDIILSNAADLMTSDTAEVKSQDNIRFTVLSLTKRLTPGSPDIVKIMVKYNADNIMPHLQKIILNGRMICPSSRPSTSRVPTKRPEYAFPGELEENRRTTERSPDGYNRPVANEYITSTVRTTPKPYTRRPTPSTYEPAPNSATYLEGPGNNNGYRPGNKKPNPNRPVQVNKPPGQIKPSVSSGQSNNNNRRPGSETNSHKNSGISTGSGPNHQNNKAIDKRSIPCGKPAVQPRPLITHGQNTTRGQWPWHVALYKNIGPNLSYSCGGTLVSDLHVVTAAHCVTVEYSSTPMDPRILLVYLGKYHLHVWTEHGIINSGVSRVTVHPQYNATDFRSDIAVLTLSSKVEFTDFIRPVCLWDKRNVRIEDIQGLEGTVVGWGYNEKKQLSEELKQAKMPVVSHDTCLWSYPEFYPKFTSNMTYCAGFHNGTSVCNGDSGGGMFFPIQVNREEHWFLRGLVSLSPGERATRVCDTYHYAVFTDVAKYLPWLEDIIS